MSAKPIITKAVAADLVAVTNLISAAYQPYLDRGLVLPDMTEGLADEIAQGRMWIATADHTIFGILNVSVEPPVAHLMNIATSSESRGSGVGSALIRHAISLAQEEGCAALALATHAELSGVVAIYEHFGFQVSERDEIRIRMTLEL